MIFSGGGILLALQTALRVSESYAYYGNPLKRNEDSHNPNYNLPPFNERDSYNPNYSLPTFNARVEPSYNLIETSCKYVNINTSPTHYLQNIVLYNYDRK